MHKTNTPKMSTFYENLGLCKIDSKVHAQQAAGARTRSNKEKQIWQISARQFLKAIMTAQTPTKYEYKSIRTCWTWLCTLFGHICWSIRSKLACEHGSPLFENHEIQKIYHSVFHVQNWLSWTKLFRIHIQRAIRTRSLSKIDPKLREHWPYIQFFWILQLVYV